MVSFQKGVIGDVLRATQNAVIDLKVNTGLNPSLWMCGVVTIPSLIVAALGPESMRNPCLWIAAVPVAIYAIGFLYFMLRDPDRLQSEKYRIQSRALDIVREKGDEVSISAGDFEIIPNPTRPKLTAPSEPEPSRVEQRGAEDE